MKERSYFGSTEELLWFLRGTVFINGSSEEPKKYLFGKGGASNEPK